MIEFFYEKIVIGENGEPVKAKNAKGQVIIRKETGETVYEKEKIFYSPDVTTLIKDRQVSPEVQALLLKMADKINSSRMLEAESDHILIIGSDEREIKACLYILEVVLQVNQHYESIKPVPKSTLSEPTNYSCDQTIVRIFERLLQNNSHKFKYLPLEELQHYPPESYGRLVSIMKTMRVVATISPEFNQLPPVIKRKFRIRIDLDNRKILDCNVPPEEPISLPIVTQGAPADSGQTIGHRFLPPTPNVQEIKVIPIPGTDLKNYNEAAISDQTRMRVDGAEHPPGGAPKVSITEAVEWAFENLSSTGNTEIIKRGKIKLFLQYLKECVTEGNSNYSDYIHERIKEVKNVHADCTIVMQARTPKEKLNSATTGKNITIKKSRISTILCGLRPKKQ